MIKIIHTGKGFQKKIESGKQDVVSYQKVPTYEHIQIIGKLADLEFLADPYKTNLLPAIKKTTPYDSLMTIIDISLKKYLSTSKSVPITKKINDVNKLEQLVKGSDRTFGEIIKTQKIEAHSSASIIYPSEFDIDDLTNYANPEFFYIEKNRIVHGPKFIFNGRLSTAYSLFTELRQNNPDALNYEFQSYALKESAIGINSFRENIIGNDTIEPILNFKKGRFLEKVYPHNEEIYSWDDHGNKRFNNLDPDYRRMVMMFPSEWEHIEPLLQKQLKQKNQTSKLNMFKEFVDKYFK